ncbi:MAG TPA: HAD family hydrolase [Sulfurivirga caldicuralii]|nr:HAD family hydrolase [Sulfurivirga caldicuralii]
MCDKRYQLVIFDWDGTLMDSAARIVEAIQHAARVSGLPVLDEKTSASIIGLSLQRAIEQLYPQAGADQVARMAQAYTHYFLHEAKTPMRPFAGAEALLQALKARGVKLAIATGKSRRGLDRILPQSGLAPYFDVTRTPMEAASKPDPLMLEQILQETGVSLEQALMVGDTTFDMEMARNLGMDRVAVSFGVHDHAELDAYGPLAHFHHLDALRQWLMTRT